MKAHKKNHTNKQTKTPIKKTLKIPKNQIKITLINSPKNT